jgi:hypothetical protein
MAGFLVSRMRSGLLCRRRWASSSSRSRAARNRHQRVAVGAALVGLAQAVELQAHMLDQAQLAPQGPGQQDQLGIHLRPAKAQRLGVRAGGTGGSGRAAGARGGTSAPRSTGAWAVVQHVVLDHGAHHAGRASGRSVRCVAVHRVGPRRSTSPSRRCRSPRPAAHEQLAVGSTMGVAGCGSHSGPSPRTVDSNHSQRAESGGSLSFMPLTGNMSFMPLTAFYLSFSAMGWDSGSFGHASRRRNAFQCSFQQAGGTRWRCCRRAASSPFRRR